MHYSRRLIHLIKTRRCLWDLNSEESQNKNLVDQNWQEVANELDMSRNEVKNKWKNLRDTYRKEYKKTLQAYGSGGNEAMVYMGTWPHFKQISFMKPIMFPGNSDCYKMEPFDEEDDFETKIPKKRVKLTNTFTTVSNDTTVVENNKDKSVSEKTEDDEDLNFFRSLLSHVRKLPELRKLNFRIEVQRLLMDELKRVLAEDSHHPCNSQSDAMKDILASSTQYEIEIVPELISATD